MELIDREEMYETLVGMDDNYTLYQITKELMHIPIAESRPESKWVHRHYIAGSGRTIDMVYCIVCGEEYSYDAETGVSAEDYNFCANCGADMRGEEE